MAIETILVIDDELLIREFLEETLTQQSFEVTTVESGKKALTLLKNHSFDMVITDMKMPDLTGIELLEKIKEAHPTTVCVVVTGFGSIENAVEAMRLGAFHYLIKPLSPGTIAATIEKANEHLRLLQENQYLRHQASSGNALNVIGDSPAMKQIMADIAHVAKSNSNVFITGESGTGKEVIAHAIHSLSLRAECPFIKVNCAAIPETLIESEFFGHEKGAFTGANAKRLGRFELAHTGTLLLDEITETPMTMQAKLLRVIQEHEFERVGSSKPIQTDVRIISTSNRNIKSAIAEKVLREDLHFRLNVVPIHIPPLRERREDIIPLAEYFLEKVCLENHTKKKQLTADAKTKLISYSWPGNVREVGNIIERAVVMTPSARITPEHLYLDSPRGMTLMEMEKKLIIETFHQQHDDAKEAAAVLGISTETLSNKLKEYEIR